MDEIISYKERIIELLPDTLDFMAGIIEKKGWNMTQALDMARTRYDHELGRALGDARRATCVGMTLIGALRHMSQKHGVQELTNVAETIIAAEKSGADMIITLRDEAQRIRAEYGR
jgi:Flp pilus assembly protein TadB